jgi:glucosyl-dolichyl phosphate glucuronosyltransferase
VDSGPLEAATEKAPCDGDRARPYLRASVIICAYTLERWDWLVAAVGSVLAQSHPPLETIVVVDRCPELLHRVNQELHTVRAVANVHSGGLSGSRQTGAQQARGEVLAFLDDDAVADPDWLAELLPVYADPLVLGAGGKVEPRWVGDRPHWFPAEFDWVVGCSHAGLPRQTSPVRNLVGASMSMRSDVLRRSGGFDMRLGRAYDGSRDGSTAEETELCIRASRLHPGGRWLYVPGARVTHHVPPTRATVRYFIRRCRMEGRAKARVAGLEGTGTGLEAERAYIHSVLPAAMARELRRALRGQVGSLGRALAITGGLVVTALAYGSARWWQPSVDPPSGSVSRAGGPLR